MPTKVKNQKSSRMGWGLIDRPVLYCSVETIKCDAHGIEFFKKIPKNLGKTWLAWDKRRWAAILNIPQAVTGALFN